MNIREHPLAWRWTDPQYVEFPPDILAQISPVDTATAAAVHEKWLPYFDKYGDVVPNRCEDVVANFHGWQMNVA